MIYKIEPVNKMFDNTRIILVPWVSRTGQLTMNIPTKVREELEKDLGYPEGTLAPNSEFLNTYMFAIESKGTVVDTRTPQGRLNYNFCKYHFQIAENEQDISKGKTLGVIRSEEAEAEIANARNKRKREALKIYDKMTIEEVFKCLRILGNKVDAMSQNMAYAKLQEFIEESEKNVDKFFALWVENTDRELEYTLEQAVAHGVVTKSKTTYKYGTDVLGVTKQDAIDYLKDKANVDLLAAIKKGIEVKTSI